MKKENAHFPPSHCFFISVASGFPSSYTKEGVFVVWSYGDSQTWVLTNSG